MTSLDTVFCHHGLLRVIQTASVDFFAPGVDSPATPSNIHSVSCIQNPVHAQDLEI
jgi:hypothetical protein